MSDYCLSNGPARFIACGGDGTVSEVLNGITNCPDSEIGVVPMGTGNDFCRNFPSDCNFQNVCYQIGGGAEKCDAIRYKTLFDGKIMEGYCVNMFNIGFDCNVADMTANMKKKPFISGSFAYFASILVSLIRKKGANLQIEIDSELCHRGPLLLTSLANGSYCGGGVKSNPLASVTDGMININIIKNISRWRFIYLLPYYMKGTVLKLSGIEKYLLSKKCHRVTVTPTSGTMRLCIDGEIVTAGKTEFEIVPEFFNFVVPKKRIEKVNYYAKIFKPKT
ncbi:MAG: hypothetical protein E7395_08535 [Ruminococcaceae bacterium]|nr:hypothetical protein [Oscillospiraceae bacterium]